MPPALRVISGAAPLVLVAPHGGRRDGGRRPWTGGGLKVNDLHTAALAAELAARSGGAALLNLDADRNDVDLNRIGETDERAPAFLERLAELVDAALGRHGRAAVLTVHGWNVVQPALDVGLGCAPGAPLRAAAVSAEFAATALPRLLAACGARGIAASVGARYPARHRENLLQLFTGRYRDDPRPRVRALAAMAPRVDAAQLECAIPLRWPGPWRRRFLAACAAALRARPGPAADDGGGHAPAVAPLLPARPQRLEFTSPAVCGLVGLDPGRGGRLLLFPPGGGLLLFTGERTGGEDAGRVGPLAVVPGEARLEVRYRGPLLRFPDTTPFLDLEAGLAAAAVVDAEVGLEFSGRSTPGGAFGAVAGRVRVAGARLEVAGQGFLDGEPPAERWPRLRVCLRLGEAAALAVSLALDDDGAATGFLERDGGRLAVTSARAALGPRHAPLERVTLELGLAGGKQLRVTARATHRLPVVRLRGASALRLELAACRLEGAVTPAGWCELGGP